MLSCFQGSNLHCQIGFLAAGASSDTSHATEEKKISKTKTALKMGGGGGGTWYVVGMEPRRLKNSKKLHNAFIDTDFHGYGAIANLLRPRLSEVRGNFWYCFRGF